MRHLIACGVLLLGATLCPPTATAQAGPTPDLAEVRAALDVGTATLTGRPRASRTKLSEAGRRRWGRPGVEHVYSSGQAVYLIPYTPGVEAQVMRHAGNLMALLPALGEAANVCATVVTDANGVFRFRALQPGRYLLVTKVPYQAAVVRREDTGLTRTDTTLEFSGNRLSGATSITSPVYNYQDGVADFDHQVVKVVEVRGDRAVTELGDLE